MKQQSFASLAYENKKKKTRRELFLAEMEQVVPWSLLESLVEPHYPKGANGRPPMGLSKMLRIYCLQQWFNLSDPGMEDALYDIEAMRRFAGFELGVDAIPDESTILLFRRLLERHELTDQFFLQINAYLKERGLIVQEGTMVDATIIHAPSSTKNKDKARDPDMSSTKKGNQWYFGMKVHIGVDPTNRVTHSMIVTTARVHDSKMLDECLHGEEKAIWGDKGFASNERRDEFESQGKEWNVHRKGSKGKPLSEEDKAWNKAQSKTRAKVEHPFLVVKQLWGHAKVRYRGLEKNAQHYFSLFALTNLYLVRRKLLQLQERTA